MTVARKRILKEIHLMFCIINIILSTLSDCPSNYVQLWLMQIIFWNRKLYNRYIISLWFVPSYILFFQWVPLLPMVHLSHGNLVVLYENIPIKISPVIKELILIVLCMTLYNTIFVFKSQNTKFFQAKMHLLTCSILSYM